MSFIVAANWKMNKGPQETKEFFDDLKQRWQGAEKVLFFISSVNATTANESLKSTSAQWGPQNIYPAQSGAFTGETSPAVMKSLGATFGLVGHSERRTMFSETNEQACKKVQSLQENGLNPILCIGETLEERKAGQTMDVLKQQLSEGLKNISVKDELHIAYEPVWAIGTGEVATVEQVSEAHDFIRQFLKEFYPNDESSMNILYGGSVKPENAKALSEVSEVGGFLIGGASLKVDSFCQIIEATTT